MESVANNFRPGIYRHYKHTSTQPRYYQVLGVARNTETQELYALYIPLYVIPEHGGPRFQVRSLGMFLEDVEFAGETMPRFAYVGQEVPTDGGEA